jgi:hypothetical protein
MYHNPQKKPKKTFAEARLSIEQHPSILLQGVGML